MADAPFSSDTFARLYEKSVHSAWILRSDIQQALTEDFRDDEYQQLRRAFKQGEADMRLVRGESEHSGQWVPVFPTGCTSRLLRKLTIEAETENESGATERTQIDIVTRAVDNALRSGDPDTDGKRIADLRELRAAWLEFRKDAITAAEGGERYAGCEAFDRVVERLVNSVTPVESAPKPVEPEAPVKKSPGPLPPEEIDRLSTVVTGSKQWRVFKLVAESKLLKRRTGDIRGIVYGNNDIKDSSFNRTVERIQDALNEKGETYSFGFCNDGGYLELRP